MLDWQEGHLLKIDPVTVCLGAILSCVGFLNVIMERCTAMGEPGLFAHIRAVRPYISHENTQEINT